ncbi:MAG: helix-turn-helix domain-containing protein [Erysipelotrichaceae bacterium]|jgi:hypothetical protein|nr:helix-turn-helix domain-containing protein [Erysipelotrichaceae bacterium]
MEKYFYLNSSRLIDFNEVLPILESMNFEYQLIENRVSLLIITAKEAAFLTLQNAISVLAHDFETVFSVLVTHQPDDFFNDYLLAHCFGKMLHLSELILLNLHDLEIRTRLEGFFLGVNHQTLMIVKRYLTSGLQESLTAKHSYMHRNTVRYQIDKFISLTKIDVRDYFDSLLVIMYLNLPK